MRNNILILSHSYASQFLESCNQYAYLFNKQHYNGTVAYLTGRHDSAIAEQTLAEQVKFLNLAKKMLRGLKLRALYKIYKLCRQGNFDQIICHRYKPSYLILIVSQFVIIPKVIFVMHAMHTFSSRFRQLLFTTLQKPSMIFAGVSPAVEADLKRCLNKIPQNRFTHFPNVMRHELFESQLLPRKKGRAFFNIAENELAVVHIGRFVEEKDHVTLLNAFQIVHKQVPNAKLYLIGDGRLEANIKQQITDLKLASSVVMTGFIENAFQYLRAFDVFVLSSIKEGFGRVLLEARVAKIPIVATSVSSIPDIVGDTGLLVPAKNVQALAAAMLSIAKLTDEMKAEMVGRAYARLLEKFSLESFYKEFWHQH